VAPAHRLMLSCPEWPSSHEFLPPFGRVDCWLFAARDRKYFAPELARLWFWAISSFEIGSQVLRPGA
jgi:hypothetical protein